MEEVSSNGPLRADATVGARSTGSVPVVGLIGGVACGKSLVAAQFAELGAAVLDGDRAGHEVLRIAEVKRAIRERWGEGVFDGDGEVRRAALAAIVFRPDETGRRELKQLEQITHPRIGELLVRQLQEKQADGHTPAIVLDAPVMLEAGWSEVCDKLVFVEAPREVRRARARLRSWSEEEFSRREASQAPLDAKRARADVVIDNSADPEQTKEQVVRFWQTLVGVL